MAFRKKPLSPITISVISRKAMQLIIPVILGLIAYTASNEFEGLK